jgi:1-acyl-sn-glycerol-3-phosphate acyltransferase
MLARPRRLDGGRILHGMPQMPGSSGGARRRALWVLNRRLMRLLFRIEVEGLERWPPAPFLLVCNHHNGVDPLVVLAAAPLRPPITWFGPKEADSRVGFKNRVMAFAGGVIPFTPDKRTLLSAVRSVGSVFATGGVIGVFAEGRIGRRESELLPFEDGAAYFAARYGVPVVPCAIVGTGELWLRKRLLVRFGPPIAAIPPSRAASAELDRRAAAAVRALLPAAEPPLPRLRPMRWLTEVLN